MGMSPAAMQMLGMIGAGVGGPVLASMFAPEGQELQSFQDVPGLRPTDFLGQSRDLMGELGGLLSDRASQPVSLPSAYVQQPGAYAGGGLPMPIGVVGEDPALGDRSILTRSAGMDTSKLSQMFRTGIPGATPNAPFDVRPGIDVPLIDPGGNPSGIEGRDTVIPGRNIDPDGPLGPDAPLGDNAFNDFYQPAFDQPQDADPPGDGMTRGTPSEARAGDFSAVLDGILGGGAQDATKRATPALDDGAFDEPSLVGEGADNFGIDSLFASASDNSGDDFDQGLANIQLLAAALSRGDVDVNALLAGM